MTQNNGVREQEGVAREWVSGCLISRGGTCPKNVAGPSKTLNVKRFGEGGSVEMVG